MACIVFIPEFQRSFASAGEPRLAALERMAARGRVEEAPSQEAFLAPRFGLEPAQLAPAPFMRLADGGGADGAYRLCASFVHLAPDRDQLVLMPGSLLEVTPDEAAALAAAFNALYGAEGWTLELISQGRAYLRCPKPLDVVTHAPAETAGQAVLDHMPTGADSMKLKQLMNETQMLFHAHGVNRAREEAGRPLINSLWFWGGGVLPKASKVRVPSRVASDLPLVRGLSIWAGRTPESLSMPSSDEDLLLALMTSDDLASMEKNWFGPLFTLLRSSKLHQLTVYLGGMSLIELDSAAPRRFWRRARPLVMP